MLDPPRSSLITLDSIILDPVGSYRGAFHANHVRSTGNHSTAIPQKTQLPGYPVWLKADEPR